MRRPTDTSVAFTAGALAALVVLARGLREFFVPYKPAAVRQMFLERDE